LEASCSSEQKDLSLGHIDNLDDQSLAENSHIIEDFWTSKYINILGEIFFIRIGKVRSKSSLERPDVIIKTLFRTMRAFYSKILKIIKKRYPNKVDAFELFMSQIDILAD
jgi:hypothetical protein